MDAGGANEHVTRLERLDGERVQVHSDVLREQGLLSERHALPAREPGLLLRHETVEVTVASEGEEHRPWRALDEYRHPFTASLASAQRPHVAVRCVDAQLGMPHGAATPQVREEPPEPLGHERVIDAQSELLAKSGHDVTGRLLNQDDGHRHRGLADPVETPATVAQVGELGHCLPAETLAHARGQLASGVQPVLLHQLLDPVPLPHHVGTDEFSHEVFGRHVER